MRKTLLLALAVSSLIFSAALAHPARPLYVPTTGPVAPPPRPPVNLNGTAWQGKYLTANRIFIFEPDGTVSYKVSAATKVSTRNRGFWRFDGVNVSFEYFTNPNTKLMEFRGKLRDPATLVGESVTRTGGKTMQSLIRTGP